MAKVTLLALCALILALLSACGPDNVDPPPPTPSMTILDAPDALLANADTCYLYRVKLENTTTDSVMVEVREPDNQVHSTFALYDDGGSGSSTYPAYACSGSGDIVPADNIFSRRINGQLLADSVTGDYQFTFRAPEVDDQVRTVTVEDIEPCLITAYPQTQVFESCFPPMTLEIQTTKTEGDEVDSVWAVIRSLLMPEVLDTLAFSAFQADTVWHATVTPHFFECLNGPGYAITYGAHTRFGMTCDLTVANVSYTNSLPVLSNSTLPDTIYRPTASGDSSLTVVTVNLDDCELAGELYYYGLEFEAYRDWQTWGRDSDFFLRDDGTSPDAAGGDGTYSSWLVIYNSDSLFNNLYYFRFYATECAAPYDTSEYLMDSVRVIQPPGLLTRAGADKLHSAADFGVVH